MANGNSAIGVSRSADLGRILGASMVCYYHIGLYATFPFSEWGQYAVGFFIVLSGVAYAGFSSVQPTDFASFRCYVAARIRAIAPAFLGINLIIFFASFLHPPSTGKSFSLVELLLSCTSLSQYFDHRYMSSVMWFVPFIMQAYLIFPGVDAVLNRISSVLVVIVAFAVSFLLVALVFKCWPARAIEICRNWSVIFRLPEVCLGVILGRCITRRSEVTGAVTALTVFAALAFMFSRTLWPRSAWEAYILSLPWNGLIVSLVIAVVAACAAVIFSWAKNSRLLRLLGTASFPFFLMHGVGILFIFHHWGARPLVWWCYLALCWCAATAFAGGLRLLTRAKVRPS